jgi:heme oxygenase
MDKNKKHKSQKEKKNMKNVKDKWTILKERFGTLIVALVDFGVTKNYLNFLKIIYLF